MVLMLRFLYIHCILIQFLKNEKKKKYWERDSSPVGRGIQTLGLGRCAMPSPLLPAGDLSQAPS